MNETASPPKATAASRYEILKKDRTHFVDRAHAAAELTLPMLFQRDASAAKNMQIKDPAQSLGARGVNSMAAKLTVSLFPMHTPFFKINLDDLGNAPSEEIEDEVKRGLSRLEKQALKDTENSGDVTMINEVMKHLLIVGNCGVYIGPEGSRLYDLNKYVVLRNPTGDVVEAVICEEVFPDSLPPKFVATLPNKPKSGHGERTLKVYTWVKIMDDEVHWHQEVEGMTVPDSKSNVPIDGNPWLFLRFIRVDGENYGRGHVEMYMGDFQSLEVLSKAINDASAAASKVLFLVRPNGTTNPNVLAKAKNLDIKPGNADDVTTLQLDKYADMQIAKQQVEEISRRLAHAFMLRSDVMRDAERVTAEEVRIVARELDEANGGIYSILSKEFQLPYVQRRIFLLRRDARIGDLPEGTDIVIVTGFSALGRGADGDRLLAFVQKAQMVMQNPEMGRVINLTKLLEEIAIADGIDTEGLLISAEEQAEAQQQQQGQDLLQGAIPDLIKSAVPEIMAQQAAQQGTSTDGTDQTQQAA